MDIETVTAALQAVFPNGPVEILNEDHWEQDSVRIARLEMLGNTIEVTVQEEGGPLDPVGGDLLGTWYGDEQKREGLSIRSAKDHQTIRDHADIIGWASLIRNRLTDKALRELLPALNPNAFLPDKCLTIGAEPLDAIQFLTHTLGMTSERVAQLYYPISYKHWGPQQGWERTRKGNLGLCVWTAEGTLRRAVAVGTKDGVDTVVARVIGGKANPLFREGDDTFNTTLSQPLPEGADPKQAGEMLMYQAGIDLLVAINQAYTKAHTVIGVQEY